MNAQPPSIPITRFPFTSFSEAFNLYEKARKAKLSAAYYPSGGDKNSQVTIPVLHIVLVIATQEQLKELRS